MAYNTKPIVKDKVGNPISQYYNPDTDSYEPVEGSHGANKVLVENNDLSLKIVEKDTKGMLDSDILVFEYQRFSEGTIAEIGQTFGMKTFAEIIKNLIQSKPSCDKNNLVQDIEKVCDEMINKPVYCHCEDIRRTDIPEVGDKRSFYINQYVYGIVRKLCGGFQEWENILNKLARHK